LATQQGKQRSAKGERIDVDRPSGCCDGMDEHATPPGAKTGL
jgi:hypothetical protein